MTLITAEALQDRLGDPNLRIADVRWWLNDRAKGRRDYAEGHIPGAVFVDVDADLAAPPGPGRHPLPSPSTFAARMAELGFDDGSSIVVYDDAGGTIAARLWWMLDDLGHADVHLLDGGIQAWVAAGGAMTAEVPQPRRGKLTLRDDWTRTIDRETLEARLGTISVIDARAPERYRGEVEPIDGIAGHIPTALNRPSGGNLGPNGLFRAPEAIRERFASLDGEVVSYCGSGITACHNALAMRLAGLPDPILYPGSYSDWTRAGRPVTTGAEPGSA